MRNCLQTCFSCTACFGRTNRSKSKVNNRVHDLEINGRSNVEGQHGVIKRVKIRMTKEEAAVLLSKCTNGRVLELKDVANELLQLPMNRISVMPSDPGLGSVGVLQTIHENITLSL